MLGIDPDVGHLRFWVASGAAALLVLVCALALDWTRSRIISRFAVGGLGAAFGAILAWAFLAGAAARDLSVERRNLEMRAAQLMAQVLAPGSPLACLDATGGENVEAACEKALFAAPATVAAASSYTAARLTLLSDIAAHIRAGGNLDSVLPSLRRALEADRFGFVAHALAIRDGCTSSRCEALALLRDPERVRANLSEQTFDRYLDRYLPLWGQPENSGRGCGPILDRYARRQPAAGGSGPEKSCHRCRFSKRCLDSGHQHHEPRAESRTGKCGRRRARGGVGAPIFTQSRQFAAAGHDIAGSDFGPAGRSRLDARHGAKSGGATLAATTILSPATGERRPDTGRAMS